MELSKMNTSLDIGPDHFVYWSIHLLQQLHSREWAGEGACRQTAAVAPRVTQYNETVIRSSLKPMWPPLTWQGIQSAECSAALNWCRTRDELSVLIRHNNLVTALFLSSRWHSFSPCPHPFVLGNFFFSINQYWEAIFACFSLVFFLVVFF